MKRDRDRRLASICELGPRLLIVRTDGRFLLGHRQAKTHIAIDVTVDEMMDDLPDGPAFGAVGCIELFFAQAGDGAAQRDGSVGDRLDRFSRLLRSRVPGAFPAANRVAELFELSHRAIVAWISCRTRPER